MRYTSAFINELDHYQMWQTPEEDQRVEQLKYCKENNKDEEIDPKVSMFFSLLWSHL